ncbi:hypothetical protein QM012_004758 [Aureobasidium pullulans]|uniref:BTB domain-containing protein n=1 Tax=Aureobasidium pullulans TaxID=5580 RepID=A0ABR0TUP4_AURPU
MSFRESISDRPATIKVGRGPHAGVFCVPKALLCNSSTYFKTALNSAFIEGQTQAINLDDEDPVVFRTYVAWLYQGQLNSQDIERALDDPQNFGQHIAELIVFADKRGITELQNDGISMFLSYIYKNGLATLDAINCIYDMPKSQEMVQLRWLLANEEAWHGRRLERNIDHWHPEYMAQIIKVYKSSLDHARVRMLGNIDAGGAILCNLVHIHQGQGCSSLAKNTYIPAPPPAQEPPKKKQKTSSTTLTVELLDD